MPGSKKTKLGQQAKTEEKLVREVPLAANPEALNEFVQEGRDLLLQAELNLFELKSKRSDPEALASLLKAMQAIKSASHFLYLQDIHLCALECENLADFLKRESRPFNNTVFEAFERAIDILRSLLTGVESALGSGKALRVPPQVGMLAETLRQVLVEEMLREPDAKPTPSKTWRKEKESRPNEAGLSKQLREKTRKLETEAAELIDELHQFSSAGVACADRLGAAVASVMEVIRTIDQVELQVSSDILERHVHDLAERDRLSVSFHALHTDWKVERRFEPVLEDVGRLLLKHFASHGLDSPEERAKAGKEAEASILMVPQVNDGHLAIEFSIDGKGDDPSAMSGCTCFKDARIRANDADCDIRVVAQPGHYTAIILDMPWEFTIPSA
ncbi:MAG: hypothetical protein KDK78_04710 [Chlamydiia bacterium]|nr:hypothetical protein [Chlamydiia bacterium]